MYKKIIRGIVLFIFGLTVLDLMHFKFFAPKKDKQNPSYIQGKEQSLSKLRFEYQKAKTQVEKDNIQTMIINEAATVNLNLLKDKSLNRFILSLRETTYEMLLRKTRRHYSNPRCTHRVDHAQSPKNYRHRCIHRIQTVKRPIQNHEPTHHSS